MPRRTTRTSAVKKSTLIKASPVNGSSEVLLFDEEPLASFLSPSKSMQIGENKENKRTTKSRRHNERLSSSNSEKNECSSDKDIPKRKTIRGKRRTNTTSQDECVSRVNVTDIQENKASLDDDVFVVSLAKKTPPLSISKSSQRNRKGTSDSLLKDMNVMKTSSSNSPKSSKLSNPDQNVSSEKKSFKTTKLIRQATFEKFDRDDDVLVVSSARKTPRLTTQQNRKVTSDSLLKNPTSNSPKLANSEQNVKKTFETPKLNRQDTFEKSDRDDDVLVVSSARKTPRLTSQQNRKVTSDSLLKNPTSNSPKNSEQNVKKTFETPKLNRQDTFEKSDQDDDVIFTRKSAKKIPVPKTPVLNKESSSDKSDLVISSTKKISRETPKLKREDTFDKTDSSAINTTFEKPNTSDVANKSKIIRQNTFDKPETSNTIDVPAYKEQEDSFKKVTVRRQRLTRQSAVLQSTPDNKSPHKDLFDFVTNTPTERLDKFMLMDGESILLNASLDDTRKSMRRRWTKMNQTLEKIPGSPSILEPSTIGTAHKKPKLDRTNTFTIDEENPVPGTPLEGKHRKRWSQVEKTPVFGVPPPSSKKESILKKHKKSVLFASPPKSTPRLRKTNEKGSFIIDVTPISKAMSNDDTSLINESKLSSFISNDSFKENKKSMPFASHNGTLPKSSLKSMDAAAKERKSVKIESPKTTPKPRLHSPLVIRKTPMPKSADNSILSSNCAKPTSRTKMPNFQKIHERRYEKMENIVELQMRRAARAQQLMSGCKLIKKTDNQASVEKETKKKLQFNEPKKELTNDVPNPVHSVKKVISKPVQKMLTKRASLEKKKREVKSKIPSRVLPTKTIEKKVTSVRKEEAKKVILTMSREVGINKVTSVRKEEAKKVIVTKLREVGIKKDDSRKQMANVRTNRRFELLMKMRNQNGTASKSSLKINDLAKVRKSVKKESRLFTPKSPLQSPLVLTKTPADNSILISNCTKPTSHSKIPNFKKIHERRLKKIVELQMRRAARARQLIELIKKTDKEASTEKEYEKNLQFNDEKKEFENNLPNLIVHGNKKSLSKPVRKILIKPASLEKKKGEVKSKIPIRVLPTKTIEKEVTTYSRKEEAKNIILTMSRQVGNRKDDNRKQMAIVRTNRRFELLMKMRNQK